MSTREEDATAGAWIVSLVMSIGIGLLAGIGWALISWPILAIVLALFSKWEAKR